MAVRRGRASNQCSVDDVLDVDDEGTLTRLRIESHARPVARRAAGRPRPDPFGRRPTAEYPEGLLELLRIRVALNR